MTYERRRARAAVVGTLVLGWIVSGCYGSARESGAVGTSGEREPAIVVETSSMYVTVENRSGAPLLDLRVAIKPVGVGTPFTTTISRLEGGERRDVLLGNFRGRDGTPFNGRLVRPKHVMVSAVDLVGKNHEVTVPWQ